MPDSPGAASPATIVDAHAHLLNPAELGYQWIDQRSPALTFLLSNYYDIAREGSGTPAQTLAALDAHVGDTTAPPGPVDSWIGEIVVHGADIRRPLGIAYSPPVATTRQVADFYKNSNLLIGSKSRIVGVRLVATDTDWSHGSGPEVRGPILSLIQAMTGRGIALSDLDGDGVPTLRAKMPNP